MDGLRDVIRRALAEDHAQHDITSEAVVPERAVGRARLVAKERCVIAGLDAFAACFEGLDVMLCASADGGEVIEAGSTVARVAGSLRAILAAERTALNLVQRLSGIATLTRSFVERAPGVEIRDTRKTTPGLRALEKAAVRAGGGVNHRSDLEAAILIKDNHIAAVRGDIAEAIRLAQKTGKHVEVECETIEQVETALACETDELLLDNMTPEMLRRAVTMAKGKARTEASGGVTLDTVAEIAATGVDSISVGALTHSAPAVDLSLEIEAI
ncbi:MAG: carboxylating nicotinate-nucleotide diphosphorylase [Actinomycetota bacterium]